MATATTVELPDGTKYETTLEEVVGQLADQVGSLTRKLAQVSELVGLRDHAGTDSQTGHYL